MFSLKNLQGIEEELSTESKLSFIINDNHQTECERKNVYTG